MKRRKNPCVVFLCLSIPINPLYRLSDSMNFGRYFSLHSYFSEKDGSEVFISVAGRKVRGRS